MRREMQERKRHGAAMAAALALVALTAGCATRDAHGLDERRAGVERSILEQKLGEDPAVRAARAELDAAAASEETSVAIDGVEIRAKTVYQDDAKVEGLLRLPIGNLLELSAERDALRAESEVALAKLEEVTLSQRVALCAPSVKYLALEERQRLYARYAESYRALLDWNDELRAAGTVDEVRLSRFELASQARLATRDPQSISSPMIQLGSNRALDALPALDVGLDPLAADAESIRGRLLRHQPEVGVHRANQERLAALSRSEDLKRMPSLSFLDFGFEPVAYPGDSREWSAGVSVDVPFGREARAGVRRYEALARAERDWERALVEERLQEATLALAELNLFRERSRRWLELAALSDAAEAVANRWWKNRLADPIEISDLFDAVYSTRTAILDARERAGLAACAVIAATGLSVSEWERESEATALR